MQTGFYYSNDYEKHLFGTPSMGYDYQGQGYTTPDVINALSSGNTFDGQTPQTMKILEDSFNMHSNASIRTPVTSTLNHSMIYAHHPMRHRSISSSMQDQESSNSTLASSPYSTNPTGDELQNVPSAGRKTSPECGDDLQRKEKKRERNRQAAQKCRTRKLTRIAELQKRVNELQGKNRDLSGLALNLKNEVSRLERQLEDHRTRGCSLLSNGYQAPH